MNISKAAWQALIPIERKRLHEKIEYTRQVSMDGEIFTEYSGTAKRVDSVYVKDNLVCTHNHDDKVNNNFLSYDDIRCGIKYKNREMRATTIDEFCHLVEIPKLKLLQKVKVWFILVKYYKFLFPLSKEMLIREEMPWNLIRKMKKELRKAGKLKFRTVPLPKHIP